MADSHAEAKHPFHLVDPSPWPLIGAFAAMVLAAGALAVMHAGNYWLLAIGVIMVLGVMFGWWRDVIKEAEHQGHHTKTVQIGLRYGMSLFIASLAFGEGATLDNAKLGILLASVIAGVAGWFILAGGASEETEAEEPTAQEGTPVDSEWAPPAMQPVPAQAEAQLQKEKVASL